MKEEPIPHAEHKNPNSKTHTNEDALIQAVASSSLRYALIGSLLIHLCFLVATCFEYEKKPRPPVAIPTRAIVHTISLHTTGQKSSPSSMAQKTERKEIASIDSPAQSIPTPTQKKESPSHQKTAPKAQNVQKKAPPKKAATKKPQAQRGTPKKETKKTVAVQKPSQKRAPAQKAKSHNIKKPAAAQKKDSSRVDESLLAEALSSLDDSASLVQSSKSQAASRVHSGKNSSQKIRMVGKLNSESDDFHAASGSGDIQSSSPEGWYVSDLIRRLQLNIRLSEPGIVRVTLTLHKDGHFASCTITDCPNTSTRAYLEQALSTIRYAPFGNAFSKESKHTFRLKLEDNGSWSL